MLTRPFQLVPRARSHPGVRVRLLTCLAALAILAGTVCSLVVSLAAFGRVSQPIGPVTAGVGVTASFTGVVDVYVPLVDWGVRAQPYRAPVAINATIQRIDRTATSRTFHGHVSPEGQLDVFRRGAPAAVTAAVLRAAWIAVLAGTVGGVLASGLVAALSGRRRVLVSGGSAALAVSVLIVAGARWRAQGQLTSGDVYLPPPSPAASRSVTWMVLGLRSMRPA